MVQRFSKLQWIYHGLAIPVCFILFIQTITLYQERSYLSSIILNPNFTKVAAFA